MEAITTAPEIVIPGSPPKIDLDLESMDFSGASDPITADQQAMLLQGTLEQRRQSYEQAKQVVEAGEADPAILEKYQKQLDKLEEKFSDYKQLKKQQQLPLFNFRREVLARERTVKTESLAREAVKMIQASDESFETMFATEEDAEEYRRRQSYMQDKSYLRNEYIKKHVLRMAGFSDRMIESGAAEPMMRQQIQAADDEPTVNAFSRWGLDTINKVEKRKKIGVAAAQAASKHFFGVEGGIEEMEKELSDNYAGISDEDRTMVRKIYNRRRQEFNERFGDVQPTVARIFNTIAQDEGIETIEGVEGFESYDAAVREFGKLTRPKFARALTVMAELAELKGQDVDGFFNKLGKNFTRASGNLFREAGTPTDIWVAKKNVEYASEIAAGTRTAQKVAKFTYPSGDPFYRVASTGTRFVSDDATVTDISSDPEEMKKAVEFFKQQKRALEYRSQIYNWRETVAKVGSENWFVNDWVYGVARSLPEMGAAATGIPGAMIVAAAQKERNMAEFRRSNPTADWEDAGTQARAWGAASAYSLLNRVQFKTATAALPKTKAFMAGLKNPFAKGAVGVLGLTGLVTGEAIQETAQDLTMPLAMNLYGAVSSDIRGFTLSEKIEESIKNFPRMMFAMVPFVVAGQVGRKALDHFEGSSFTGLVQNKTVMDRLNIDEETQQDLLEMTPEEIVDFIQENADILEDAVKEDLPDPSTVETEAQINANEDGTFTVTNGTNTVEARSLEEAAEAVQQLDPEIVGRITQPETPAQVEPASQEDAELAAADTNRLIIDRKITADELSTENMVFHSFILPNLTGRPRGMQETEFSQQRKKQGLPPAVDPETRAAVEKAARLRYGLRRLYFYKEAPGQLRKIGQEASRRIAGVEAQFNEIAKNIDIEVQRHVKKKSMNMQDAAFINFQTNIYNALRGNDKAMRSLPAKIRRSLMVARESIDVYSGELAKSGMIDGELAAKVGDNLGSYVFRQFKAFDPKYKWNYATVKKSHPEIYKAALDEVMAEGLPQKEADLVLREMLDPERGEDFYGGNSKVGKISVTSLIKRKDLSPAMLEYLGEITNPAVNIRNTGAKVSKMVITYHAQRHMAEQLVLMGQGSWKKDGTKRHTAQIGQKGTAYPIKNEEGEAEVRYRKRTEKPMEGFRDFYTDPELAAELEKYFNPSKDTTPFTALGDALATITGIGKFAQVILNLAAYPTNFFGGVFTEIFNGRVSFDAKGMRAYIKIGSFRNFGKEKESAPYGVKEQQEFYSLTAKEYAAQGGINSMRRSQLNTEMEMRGNRDNSVFANDINEGIESGLFGDKLSMASRVFGKGYQSFDNAAKRSAFAHEVNKWMEAEPDKNMDEILDLASADVRETTQHYDMVPHFLKEFSQRGVVIPTYLSFGWELFRNTIGTAKLASREIFSGNPVLRRYGMKRVAGMLVVGAAMHALTTAISQILGDLTDEDREKLRAELPPWLEGIELAYLKANGKELVYFDPSYIIPHHVFYSAAMRAFKAETAEEKFEQSAKTILGPIAGQNVFFQAITEINTNQKTGGGKIYNEAIAAENPIYKLRQQLAHIGESVYTPGIVRSYRKYKKAKSGEVGYGGSTASTDDLILNLFGIRPYRRDITSDRFVKDNIAEFTYASQDVKGFANKKEMERAGKEGEADPKTGLTPKQKQLKEDSERTQKKLVEKFLRSVEFLRKVGVSRTRILKGFKDAKTPMYLRKEALKILNAED